MERRATVDAWDVIVIGHLKWNPYFGETKEAPPRGDPSTCTSVLVRGRQADGSPFALLVDPTLRHNAGEYYFDLNRRTGLHPEDITHCFSTHSHFDHQAGLNYFPYAQWMAADGVADELADSPYIDGCRVRKVHGEFLPGTEAVPLPGHTLTLHGVAFWHGGKHILVAGDAVMTQNHFRDQTTMFEADAGLAAETIRQIKGEYDIIIPGHDNMIVNDRTGAV